MNVLGIDIGGSAIKGAPVDTKTGRLLAERHRIPTRHSLKPESMAKGVAKLVQHFRWKGPIGCGFPGVVEGGVIRFVGNVHPDFVGCDVADLFARTLRRPVALINDADAAGIAEVRFGAGQGVKGNLLLLTFGTGVGSALFVDGRIYPNTEFGHLPIKGKSAERRVSASARDRKDLSFKKWSRRVSAYLNILETLLWPRLIIVGGGISADHAKWIPHLKVRTPVVPASFLNEAGIVGAALHATENVR